MSYKSIIKVTSSIDPISINNINILHGTCIGDVLKVLLDKRDYYRSKGKDKFYMSDSQIASIIGKSRLTVFHLRGELIQQLGIKTAISERGSIEYDFSGLDSCVNNYIDLHKSVYRDVIFQKKTEGLKRDIICQFKLILLELSKYGYSLVKAIASGIKLAFECCIMKTQALYNQWITNIHNKFRDNKNRGNTENLPNINKVAKLIKSKSGEDREKRALELERELIQEAKSNGVYPDPSDYDAIQAFGSWVSMKIIYELNA